MFVRVNERKGFRKIQYINSGLNKYFSLDVDDNDTIYIEPKGKFKEIYIDLWYLMLNNAPQTCKPLSIPVSCEFLVPEKTYNKILEKIRRIENSEYSEY